jgi:multimeric flavodoxin WrbA
MKVIGIAASPRRHGNSETLLDYALTGARFAGVKTEKVVLSLLDIRPCRGIGTCMEKGICHIRDDMAVLIKKIDDADGVIISSPVYFGSVTAQLKTMIDRCQGLWVKRYVLKVKRTQHKKGAFLCISSYNNRRFFRNSREIIDILFKVLGMDFTEKLYFGGLESKDDARHNKALLKKAFRCGEGLSRH